MTARLTREEVRAMQARASRTGAPRSMLGQVGALFAVTAVSAVLGFVLAVCYLIGSRP